MRLAGIVTLVLCVFFCSEVYSGLGEPLSSDSLDPDQRKALVEEITENVRARVAKDAAGEERACAIVERLPDSELRLLARNIHALSSGGGVTLAEFFVQLVLVAALLGLVIILLLVFGVVALFAGASAASSSKGAPMGKHQYEEQRRKTEDTKEIGRPVEQEK